MNSAESRREIKTRNARWAQQAAAALAKANISPNKISILSVACGLVAIAGFILALENSWYLLLAIVGIQTRLLCNLFDGMVAVEYNKKSAVGELYNEVPDRISDALIILGAGIVMKDQPYAMDFAWANVFLATMTAYVRVFGASLGLGHQFLGPMAKQHRMFLLTFAALIQIFVTLPVLYYAQMIMLAGLLLTVYRRLSKTASALQGKRS